MTTEEQKPKPSFLQLLRKMLTGTMLGLAMGMGMGTGKTKYIKTDKKESDK